MTTIWERTKAALTGLNAALAADEYIPASGGTFPDSFLVYTLVSAPAAQHADGAETLRQYRVQVSIYSRSGLGALTEQVISAMVAAGFMRLGMIALGYDTDTRHFGAACDFGYLEDLTA